MREGGRKRVKRNNRVEFLRIEGPWHEKLSGKMKVKNAQVFKEHCHKLSKVYR